MHIKTGNPTCQKKSYQIQHVPYFPIHAKHKWKIVIWGKKTSDERVSRQFHLENGLLSVFMVLSLSPSLQHSHFISNLRCTGAAQMTEATNHRLMLTSLQSHGHHFFSGSPGLARTILGRGGCKLPGYFPPKIEV
jgi:hypothetical protein